MEAGGWSAHGIRAAAAAAKAKKKTAAAAKKKKKAKKNDASTSREQPRHPGPFAEIPGITDALRERLESIGATEPTFMIDKSLVGSDVHCNQARLLFSCKRESPSKLTGVFTVAEMRFVEDKTINTGGLLVTAFDRAGRRYDLVCKYLDSNAGYRFITGWKAYVEDNGLGVETWVELWRFRSRKLHNRYVLRRGENGKEEKVPVMVDIGHPDGSLGLVLLHYRKNDLQPEQAAADEPDEAPHTTEEKEVFKAAIGLLKLREYLCGGGGGGGGGRQEQEPKVEKQEETKPLKKPRRASGTLINN